MPKDSEPKPVFVVSDRLSFARQYLTDLVHYRLKWLQPTNKFPGELKGAEDRGAYVDGTWVIDRGMRDEKSSEVGRLVLANTRLVGEDTVIMANDELQVMGTHPDMVTEIYSILSTPAAPRGPAQPL